MSQVMEKIKLLSVFTGHLTDTSPKQVMVESFFKVDSFPYTINFTTGVSIMFRENIPEFGVKFDIFDPNNTELNSDVHDVAADIQTSRFSKHGIRHLQLSFTPRDHVAHSEGVYRIRATITDQEGDVLDSMDTYFILSEQCFNGDY
ncbi:hypothetical protein PTR80_03595 [Serratia nevei]|uniref:hypothetical protein n=1 Tax=Serratia nevei TaxID=2703794 RepID=UPI00313C14FD